MNDSEKGKIYAIFDTAANRKIIADLRSAGAKLFAFPPVAPRKTTFDETQNAYFSDLARFDWLIFADVFTVDFFLEILEENALDVYDLDALRVGAFGEIVSDRLRFAAVHADVIPAKNSPSEFFAALTAYIGESEIAGLKFLFLKSEVSGDNLTLKLSEANAEVVEISLYQTESEANGELVRLQTLLKNGAIDEFVLTAPEDLTALGHYFGNENLAEIFAEIDVAAADGVMFQAAREHNLRRVGLFQPLKIDKVS